MRVAVLTVSFTHRGLALPHPRLCDTGFLSAGDDSADPPQGRRTCGLYLGAFEEEALTLAGFGWARPGRAEWNPCLGVWRISGALCCVSLREEGTSDVNLV